MLLVPLVSLGGEPPAPEFDVSAPPPATTRATSIEPHGTVVEPPPPAPARSATPAGPATPAAPAPAPTTGTPPDLPATTTTTTAAPPAPTPTTTTPRVAVALPPLRPPLSPTQVASTGSERGLASWFNAPDETCAHRTLPVGTVVTVTRLSTGATTTCTVDQWGPADTTRVIDLSMDTFEKLAAPEAGLVEVLLEW